VFWREFPVAFEKNARWFDVDLPTLGDDDAPESQVRSCVGGAWSMDVKGVM
jgi:hypothetical protein